jgi:ABC-type multidrug transport system ATPase subunit
MIRFMLELREVTVTAGAGEEAPVLLSEVTARFPRGEVCALLGPSGSGKTTLVRAVAGIAETSAGSLHWEGVDLDLEDLPPSQIGYVPQFTISEENLTAEENVVLALRLPHRPYRNTSPADSAAASPSPWNWPANRPCSSATR